MFANHRTHQRVNVGEAYALVESRQRRLHRRGRRRLGTQRRRGRRRRRRRARPHFPDREVPAPASEPRRGHRGRAAGPTVRVQPLARVAADEDLVPVERSIHAASPPRCAAQSPAAPMYSRIAAHASSRGSCVSPSRWMASPRWSRVSVRSLYGACVCLCSGG